MTYHSKYNILIPVGMKPRPKIHEETAADILANHFKSNVQFLETASHGTPDISIQGVEWELKSPIGSSKNNIRKNMREPGTQSVNVIIDLRRSKLHPARALGYVNEYMTTSKKLKRVVVITKTKRILTIKVAPQYNTRCKRRIRD